MSGIKMEGQFKNFEILDRDAEQVARQLLGCYLMREVDGQRLVGKIVETEAYDQHDAASHSYRGQTPRTEVMFGFAGHAYVYFTYGMHYCMNIVTGPAGHGSAVLIRALEPVEGLEQMTQNRGGRTDLCNGPAKLCQALKIDKSLNGHDMNEPPLQLIINPSLPKSDVTVSTRIGIKHDSHRPWRFYIKNNDFVSKK